MSALYMIVGTLMALGVLVTFHEFGHFWVARRCGVKVLRFSVGFGMPLLRWYDRQGTEFVIAAIPLGGYVKMLDEREGEVPVDQLDQSFNRKSVRQRIAIVAAGPVANFLLALVFFWGLAMLGTEQVRPVIGSVESGSIAAKAGLSSGQEIVAIDGEPTVGWSAVNLQLIRRLGESGTLQLLVREQGSTADSPRELVLENWLKGTDEPDPIRSLGIRPWRPALAPVLAELDPKGPAQAAGLKTGDRLLALDGQALTDWQQVVDWVRVRPDTKIVLHVERDGAQIDVPVTLAARGKEKVASGYLGAGVKAVDWPPEMLREVSYGPLAAIGEGARRTWTMSVLTLDSLKKMLFGELSVKNLSGPITIAKVAGASAQSGVADFLNFLAYLSISLGVLNLLPIPVLDGGHLLFYLIEWARGRPLSDRVQGWGIQIGISLVVGVMLLALVNDLGRL
ncbi:site-2 protease. Metallo peptidase. MEROPS family M50B [Pseudomonas chlororaphis]|uniref:sigma E protease regulator RseP n=1 Tax=Pseudomonas chlororaphis TaxID=587753 RepID=UPI00087DB1DA|nr:sigma E protease regulator RseP [Pseudomonas chlororaphis]AZD65095.1 Intramembrane protease RasP/YluC, implicated in cell division based on FtsL cleavage [Pseudomonas chlororaphis subsp. aurantiaca]QIT21251.1 sigma E protease regulator RseP [Pseudomonas chlororaphis subsp. aurantiaca]WDH05405.1 sigma E protease regulator RseP [Pseudomonas chlororaphis]WDH11840.1 sigma E protease regulator RseP [Pseudomonas chlororaphis]SDT57235.1 site-2 protease. Metallo peptidase. MEROPS family M50B [Pseud